MRSFKKIAIIGSGPIIIGQAAEFDYAGTQACLAIKEEGIETVLINSNPATIMTDRNIADKVYIEPLTFESVKKILEKEKVDGLLVGFGGQTGLNLATELEGKKTLQNLNIELLGVNKENIKKAEDRDEFKKLMEKINEPIPKSIIANDINAAKKFIEKEGYPVIIRPAYTLGGTGGGFANNKNELKELVRAGLDNSPVSQILIEKSVFGWKEIEFEVMRDRKNNCITICSMENFDPDGIHTGDSIVVCPVQTLRDREYQKLRSAALKIIRALNIEGGCNIQFAMHPKTGDYIVIEVNPRVSRSSALASKAAGYPIAKLAAKIAIGYSLDELKNYVTLKTSALFEPTLDYCVIKFPKWPFDKFRLAERTLGTQMKATGEIMAISRTFESALLKAVTSLEIKIDGLRIPSITLLSSDELVKKLSNQDDERLFVIAELLRREILTVEKIHKKTMIDNYFLYKLKNIIDMEKKLYKDKSAEVIREADSMGFTDNEIKNLTGLPLDIMQKIRADNNIYPVYKMVDTCGGEFEAKTPYFYSSYDDEDEATVSKNKKILIVGSGPIRIGQGIEFDYICVQGVNAVRKLGYEAIIINNNPETVSTDFDISDRLYFEPLHIDDVLNIIKKEKPYGVILQYGGQTSLNLAEELSKRHINILGTSFGNIDLAEDREKFHDLLTKLNIPTPKGLTVASKKEAEWAIEELGLPVVVRPSYVIGGRAMQVVYSKEELLKYLKEAVSLSKEHPVLIDKYISGKEMEIDAISDGKNILIPGIMEHIEKTGVHSGDSISSYPPFSLSEDVVKTIISYAEKVAKELNIVGLFNIQFAYDNDKVFIIELNPRGSRTVPILSKVTGIPMVYLATAVMVGKKLSDLGYGVGLSKSKDFFAIKAPVFSSEKLTNVDISLGPEMRSTGEVLGIDKSFKIALYKAFLASNVNIIESGGIYISLRDIQKTKENAKIIKEYADFPFKLFASKKTNKFLEENYIKSEYKTHDEIKKMIGDDIKLIINVPEIPNKIDTPGFSLRRKAIEWNLPVLTSMDTANAFLKAIKMKKKKVDFTVRDLGEVLGD
ncbi:MAG: carbamoyl-phosphate synthase (glutamine-hydrolyzing) large subunit [Clostridiales Family XIII bacterium]|jgi:carbamoyl-phosphate synthase large subunit|nr:carbamoyl-phosphate synthase (glutamine-hydrolyzing) large subunit [Clostridiales Family XIII bacterium]